jgi:hypothetical protein
MTGLRLFRDWRGNHALALALPNHFHLSLSAVMACGRRS